MFQEEMNKIRKAENEADRRLADCEKTVKRMQQEADTRNRASLEDAKTKALRLREEKKTEAEQKANAVKEEASRQTELEAEKIRADAESHLDQAVSLIVEGVKKHGSC